MACNLYLVVGYNGGIWSGRPEPGGEALVKETTDTTQNIWAVASNATEGSANFTCFATGSEGKILKSDRVSDTTSTWSTVYNAGVVLRHINHGNGIWIAVGENNTVVRSTDGVTWTKTKGSTPSATWTYIVYGNGKWVVSGGSRVGSATKGAIMYSTDNGLTWTKGSAGTTSMLLSLTYSPELNKFVSVGYNGSIVSVEG